MWDEDGSEEEESLLEQGSSVASSTKLFGDDNSDFSDADEASDEDTDSSASS